MESPHARFTVFRKGTKKTVVRPPFDRVSKGPLAKVNVRNTTGDLLLVSMPGGVFDSDRGEPDPPKVHTVTAHDTLTLKVHDKAAEGVYEFQIFSKETFSFAEANSDPEFIID